MLTVRRALVGLAALSVLAAIFAWLTGGVGWRPGGVRVSLHNPIRPLIMAAACAGAALLLRLAPGGRTSIADEWAWWAARLAVVGQWVPLDTLRRIHPAYVIAGAGMIADVSQWMRAAPLWLDEQMIAINLRDRSFAELSGTLWLGQSAPLGWLWLQRGVLVTIGPGELALRFLPLLFGIATVGAAAWIARRWFRPVPASLFVVLCWISATLSHYRFELKHYSADTFWALLLPALAVWTVDDESLHRTRRRQVGWFIVAGVGLWFANGAMLVAPGCVLWMLGMHIRRRDVGSIVRFVLAGTIWLVLFGGHYALSLRYTHHNPYLRYHWADRVPPPSAGIVGTATWIAEQLPTLARDAAGTSFPILFWIAAVAGFFIASNRRLALAYATVPIAALVLAAVRLVPIYERFSLWIVPALYLGLTLAAARGFQWMFQAVRTRALRSFVGGAAAFALALWPALEIIDGGKGALDIGVPGNANHAMDDRTGVAWLMRQRQPGDAIVTTRLGWPAIWWYGGISLAPDRDGRLPDGTMMYEVFHTTDQGRCGRLYDLLRNHRRVLVYFSFPDMPQGFDAVLLRELSPTATITAAEAITTETRVAVIEWREAFSPAPAKVNPLIHPAPALGGCVDVHPALRW